METTFTLIAQFTLVDSFTNVQLLQVRRGPNDELRLTLSGVGGVPYSLSNLQAKTSCPAFCEETDVATVATVQAWLNTALIKVTNVEYGTRARQEQAEGLGGKPSGQRQVQAKEASRFVRDLRRNEDDED